MPQAVTMKSTLPNTKVPGGVSPETARGSHTISHQFPMNYGRNRFPREFTPIHPHIPPFLMAWGRTSKQYKSHKVPMNIWTTQNRNNKKIFRLDFSDSVPSQKKIVMWCKKVIAILAI